MMAGKHPVTANSAVFIDDNRAEPIQRPTPSSDDREQHFFMSGDDLSYENTALYRKHGFHPIVLGDILPEAGTCQSDKSKAPQYRIMQKLGFGAFATVWLARDLLNSRFVAVKVSCGTDKPLFSREADILLHIKEHGGARRGFENILTLHEAFIISGPNGMHECLVTEVVAPSEGLGITQGWTRKEKLKQIASGVSLLHSQGIAHGDIHADNLGVAVPGIQNFSEEEIMDQFLGDIEVIPVVPRDPKFPRDAVPVYITPPVELGAYLQQKGQYPNPETVTFKLIDFGRAFAADQPPRHLPGGAPFMIRPPEVFVYDISQCKAGSLWGKEADIWALGCVIWPTYLIDQQGSIELYPRLVNALRAGGSPPEQWLKYLDPNKLSISSSSPLATNKLLSGFDLEAAKGWKKREELGYDVDQENFVDLVRQMVTTIPGARIGIEKVLAHPWLLSGQ